MEIEALWKTKQIDILRIATKHGAHNVQVFGSVASGEGLSGHDTAPDGASSE